MFEISYMVKGENTENRIKFDFLYIWCLMLGDRIKKAADLIGGIDALVLKTGIKRTTLYDYVNDRTEPKASTLVELAKTANVHLQWLATGEGPMCFTEDGTQLDTKVPPIHGTLLKLVGRAVTRIYKDEGIKLPADALIEEIGGRYNELIARAENPTDLDELTSLIPWLENKVRKELQAAASEPGTGKHSA